jgi:aspartyl protease family protein
VSDGDQALGFVYLLGCLALVLSALMVRRIPIALSLKMFFSWVLIFLAAFVAFTLKDDFLDLGRRVVAEARGEPVAVIEGRTLRIRQSFDGHYWVTGSINGQTTRFLIDSGATVTSISTRTAQRAGIDTDSGLIAMVQTANGKVMVKRGRASSLVVGPIERSDLAVHVSDGFGDTNVLGMNFLSSLSGWGVEKRWLVLKP